MPADLVLSGVSVRFGGLLAVNDVSLRAPAGSVTGLIGANGAGKTTIFNACAGVVSTTSGTVSLGDRRLDGASPAKRAQSGLGRTFQRIQLIESASVRDNVAFGPETLGVGRHPWGMLTASRKARAAGLAAADPEIARCGLTDIAESPAAELSTGQGRLVDLARVLASSYEFLLLDEPSSGLDKNETERFGEIVAAAVEERGLGILLVEHDMALIRQLCTYIYVLDFGRLIYQGEAAEVLGSAALRNAYLGSDPDAGDVNA